MRSLEVLCGKSAAIRGRGAYGCVCVCECRSLASLMCAEAPTRAAIYIYGALVFQTNYSLSELERINPLGIPTAFPPQKEFLQLQEFLESDLGIPRSRIIIDEK